MTGRLKLLAKREKLPYTSISRTKVQSFMKRYLGFSYKNKIRVPEKKTTKSHHRLRTTWILQFLTLTKKWNCRNVISIDETSWSKVMNRKRSWSQIGFPERVREARGGKTLTFLGATSVFGLELFMIVEGAVNSPTWCYFIAEIEKQVFRRLCRKTEGMNKKDILLIYDNCRSHISGLSNWWMKNIDAYKLTISTYTPEFNMIERFFLSLKHRASDGVGR